MPSIADNRNLLLQFIIFILYWNMELFQFCWEIIMKEGERFNGRIQATTNELTAGTAADINYDIVHKRCAFIYRCGTINLYFAKLCYDKFFSGDKIMLTLLTKWVTCTDSTLCSLSTGPALDYIALLLSYKECGLPPPLFKNIKIVTKYGAWRNTTNIMSGIINGGFLGTYLPPIPIGNIEVIQGDPFLEFSEKVRSPISSSDVVLMMKRLNLSADTIDPNISKSIKEFIGALKPGAVLFCIDTKPSINEMIKCLSLYPGDFLFSPLFLETRIILENLDAFRDAYGCYPVLSARGSFFVWKKSSTYTKELERFLDKGPESVANFVVTNESCSEMTQNDCAEAAKNNIPRVTNFVGLEDIKNFELGSSIKPVENVDSCYQSSIYPSSNSFPNTLIASNFPRKGTEDSFFRRASSGSFPNLLFPTSDNSNKEIENISSQSLSDNSSQRLSASNSINKEGEGSCSPSSKYSSSPDSLQGGTLLSLDFLKKEIKNSILDSFDHKSNSSSASVCVQTELLESLSSIKPDKITELTNKIANLTEKFSEVLESSESVRSPSKTCWRNSEEPCICCGSVPNDDCQSHCPHICCRVIPPCILNHCRMCFYQNQFCKQHFRSNVTDNLKTETSLCDSGITSPCKDLNNASNSSNKNTLPSVPGPHLVIPLANLSADVISQIVALLNKSNQ